MSTPELVVWVVVSWNDENIIEVQDRAYPTCDLAQKRVDHLINWDGLRASTWPVKIHQAPAYVMPPLPPSTVFTKEDPKVKMQVAYDAPRRVWAGQPSLADVVCETWAAWAQTASGAQPSDVPDPESVERLFEESPEGTKRLFPRELP